jgi:hypothetical protein
MNIRKKACYLLGAHRNDLRVKNVIDIPENCTNGVIYLVGNADSPQYAVFRCPCGCGRTVELNLNETSSPCWSVTWHWSGAITLSPSIWRKNGCKSHFFIIKSKVKWCGYR